MTHDYLTTGQMAKLHNINKKTLMFYDRIGLFSPDIVGENNYRYYRLTQIPKLEVILSLRSLNYSIEEIRMYLNEKNPQNLENILSSLQEKLDHQIKTLTATRNLISNKAQSYTDLNKKISSGITLKSVQAEDLYISKPLSDKNDLEIYQFLSEAIIAANIQHLFCHTYGSIMWKVDIDQGIYNKYRQFFIKAKNPDADKRFIRPSGTYLIYYHKGNWRSLPAAYKKVISYMQSKSLKQIGNAYEENIIDVFSTDIEDDYITKIMIPVQQC